ncbi:hypothetical protein HDU77_004813 [Chytriomyces hyalinus]|nr:hypothetical protein HDU77_004813 [Chytriomyces hyalinus]
MRASVRILNKLVENAERSLHPALRIQHVKLNTSDDKGAIKSAINASAASHSIGNGNEADVSAQQHNTARLARLSALLLNKDDDRIQQDVSNLLRLVQPAEGLEWVRRVQEVDPLISFAADASVELCVDNMEETNGGVVGVSSESDAAGRVLLEHSQVVDASTGMYRARS